MVSKMKKKHRVGVIGCGGISATHIRGIMESPDLEVGALCDILPEKLKEKQILCSAADHMCYGNYIEMLDSGKIDAVSICTPNNMHFEMAMEAVKRSLPYATEKPACGTEAQVAELMKETEKKNLPNMVCFSYRFIPAARYARDIILSGALGKLTHVNADYLQQMGLPGPDGELVPLIWRFIKDIAFSGALGDLGCHLIDMCRFMVGCEFTRISADYDTFVYKRPMPDGGPDGDVTVDDYVNIIGQMEGRIAANLSISRFAYGRENYQRIEVYGEKGGLRYNLEGYIPDFEDRLEINIGNTPMKDTCTWTVVPVPKAYKASQMQSFADILNGCGDGLAADIQDGWKTQRVLDGAIDSAEKGLRVVL